MNWTTHPHLSLAAVIVAAGLLLAAAGCRNQTGGAVNPFLAPDRVPPPATRAILPGQAQPYYPGDPLPVMQSAAPSAAAESFDALAQNAPAWNPPGIAAAAGSSGAVATSSNASAATAAQALAFSNEPTVAIPTDNDDLRFAATQAMEPASVLPVAPVEPSRQIAATHAPQQAMQLANAPERSAVVPASYTEPVIKGPLAADNGFSTNHEPVVAGPWRSPQIPARPQSLSVASTLPATAAIEPPIAYGAAPTVAGVAPLTPHANTMDVRIRAVPSPPEPVETNTPRIRLPGYAEPQPWIGAGTVVRPIVGSRVPTAAMGPLPPPPHDIAGSLVAAPTSVAGHDGFRPRSTMR